MIRVDLYDNGGLMTGMGIGDWITIVAGAFGAIWALRLMKPEHYDEIMEVWDKKWNKDKDAGPGAELAEASDMEPNVELTEASDTELSAE